MSLHGIGYNDVYNGVWEVVDAVNALVVVCHILVRDIYTLDKDLQCQPQDLVIVLWIHLYFGVMLGSCKYLGIFSAMYLAHNRVHFTRVK